MDNKYNDFALCTPEQFELIAKKYSEQICTKKTDYSNAYNYINMNLLLLEQSNFALAKNQFDLLQKIYIKTNNLKKLFPQATKTLSISKPCKIFNLHDLKNASITNLCMAIGDFCCISEPKLEFVQKAIDLICEYCKI